MNKILSAIKRAPKRFIALTAVLLAIIVPVAIQAWGPNRQTFTIEQPATFNTFNSITNNPNIGDERNFVGARRSGSNNLWSSDLTIQRGNTYDIRLYVHNNAADGLGLVAENVRAMINVPSTTGRNIEIAGFIDSTNSTPNRIWDVTRLNAGEDFNLKIVPGSARFYNNHWGTTGVAIPDSVFTSQGTLLGYNALDGRIPGCFHYAGVLVFTVQPQFAETLGMNIDKTVRILGETGTDSWRKVADITPGTIVEYQIYIRNTSSVTVENVQVVDILPAGMTYIPGSTVMFNSNHPNGVTLTDGITTTGINIGSMAPNGNAFIRFQAQAASATNLTCGYTQKINRARAGFTELGNMRESTATVNVYRECEEEPPVVPPIPPELPVTGSAAGVIGSIIALGSLATSGAYYWISRKRA